jgi:hypothetical protein
MTTDTPRQAALNTTEILENILSYLPNRTVFGVQRVCRQWRDAIAVSPTIQGKLFLRLRGQTPETWLLNNPEEKKFRVAAPADIESPSEVNFGQRPLFMPVTLNPLLEWWDEAGLWIEENSVQHYACVARGSNFIRFAQHSSARATFITDPPSKECQVGLDFEPRPMRPEFRFMGSCANSKSDQPLALGKLSVGHCNRLYYGFSMRNEKRSLSTQPEIPLWRTRSSSWKSYMTAKSFLLVSTLDSRSMRLKFDVWL